MPTQPTPTTLPDLLRFYLRGALDAHSFNTHLLLILIDQAEAQELIKTLLDEALTELQLQAQDIAALAAHVEMVLPSQQGTDQAHQGGSGSDENSTEDPTAGDK